jgi:cyclophilin family peptidyl-prolyl cis-trans isomerase
MSKKRTKKRHVPPSVEARRHRKQAEIEAAARRRNWWIGGAGIAILAATVVLWFTVGPGKPAEPMEWGFTPQASMPATTSEPLPTSIPVPTVTPLPESTLIYTATITTVKGEIVVHLYPEAAPLTVDNFVKLSREGFYDGLTFHRVEPGFVIQGGDPNGDGSGGPGYTVPAEIGLTHTKGAIAMARTSDAVNPERASSGSQFYIALDALPQLDGAYTVFGQVVEGMDVVQSIAIGDVIDSITIAEE